MNTASASAHLEGRRSLSAVVAAVCAAPLLLMGCGGPESGAATEAPPGEAEAATTSASATPASGPYWSSHHTCTIYGYGRCNGGYDAKSEGTCDTQFQFYWDVPSGKRKIIGYSFYCTSTFRVHRVSIEFGKTSKGFTYGGTNKATNTNAGGFSLLPANTAATLTLEDDNGWYPSCCEVDTSL